MPSALAALPVPAPQPRVLQKLHSAASRRILRHLADRGSTVLCFPSCTIVNWSLCRLVWPQRGEGDRARTLSRDACGGDQVALLDAGASGRAVGGDRGDQRTARVVGVEAKALGDRGVTF